MFLGVKSNAFARLETYQQLNIWGFSREIIERGCDDGWSHPNFRRGNPSALSMITRKLEIGIRNKDRHTDASRDDVQLQNPGLDATLKHSNAAAHAHTTTSESNQRNLNAEQMMHETMGKVMTDNSRLVDPGVGYLTMGHSGTWPQRDEGEMHHRFAPEIRTNGRPVHHLSAARAANTYCPNETFHRKPTVANLNTAFEGYVTSSRSMPEPGSATILKPVAGEEDGCLLNDGMSMSKRVSFKRKRNFFASLQTDAVADDEASQNEALARARAKPPHLSGQGNLKRSDSLPVTTISGQSILQRSDSLPVITTSASRNPAFYCGHAIRTRHNHIEQRPTSMPTASTPAVDSDDFLLFLHRMIDMVDDDSSIRSDEVRNDSRRQDRRPPGNYLRGGDRSDRQGTLLGSRSAEAAVKSTTCSPTP